MGIITIESLVANALAYLQKAKDFIKSVEGGKIDATTVCQTPTCQMTVGPGIPFLRERISTDNVLVLL